MRLTTFVSFAVFSTAISAAPQPHISQSKRRGLHARKNFTTAAEVSQVLWSGVVITGPYVDEDGQPDPYLDITAKFVVPTPQDKNPGSVFAWIGIDGDDVDSEYDPVIQTGIEIETLADGTTVYTPFYEWAPTEPVPFPEESDDGRPFIINPGDELTFAIEIRSTMDSATAIITNGDLTLSMDFSPTDSNNIAKGLSAELVMERVALGNTFAPLLIFGTFQLTNCVAVTAGDESVSLAGGPAGSPQVPVNTVQIINRKDDPTVLASGSIIDGNTAQIVWSNAGSTICRNCVS